MQYLADSLSIKDWSMRASKKKEVSQTDVAARVLEDMCQQFVDSVFEQLRVFPNLCTAYFTILLLRSCAKRKHFSLAERYSK